MQWYVLKGDVQLGGEAQAFAQSYDGTLTVAAGSRYYGTFVGRQVTVSGSGAFHVDTSNSATVANLGGGFDLRGSSRPACGGWRCTNPFLFRRRQRNLPASRRYYTCEAGMVPL